MIIVEGVDGSGKTTLVNRICEEFDMDCEEKVVGKDTKIIGRDSLKDWVENDLHHWPKAAIYDRHRLISEPIYAPIMRGRLTDGFDNLIWYTKQIGAFWKHKPVVIFCMPPPEIVVKNILDSGDENAVIFPAAAALYWSYHLEAARNLHRPNVATYDYTTDKYEDILYYIGQHLKEEFTRHASVINRYFPDARKTDPVTVENAARGKRSSGNGWR